MEIEKIFIGVFEYSGGTTIHVYACVPSDPQSEYLFVHTVRGEIVKTKGSLRGLAELFAEVEDFL